MIGKINRVVTDDITKVENYEEALLSKEKYVMHHKLEMFFTMKELKDMGRYYHVPARELIFLKKSEHDNNVFWHKGTYIGISKMSKSKKGKPTWNKGKKMPEEFRKKTAEAHKGKCHSEETKRKMAESHKGKHWYTNGIINILEYTCPEGFTPGQVRK